MLLVIKRYCLSPAESRLSELHSGAAGAEGRVRLEPSKSCLAVLIKQTFNGH